MSGFGELDLHLFNEGTHARLYRLLGAQPSQAGGAAGTRFSVWAPNASAVSLISDANGWQPGTTPLHPLSSSGIWTVFVPGVGKGLRYKYHITGLNGHLSEKADPYGYMHEIPPATASVVWDLEYRWNDGDWMRTRQQRNAHAAPMSIYEVHLGSWMRVPEEDGRSMSYREIAPRLADYVAALGYTHVELMPVMEHPFYGSWGYQVTGYFAPTSRYGTPQDFMYLVDHLHQRGIGVILDWVPAHFPTDAHGLGYFDGSHLYEHADARQGFHPDWNTFIFNYDRHEVRSFLLSSALFWLDHFHADGLRVDGVASMLYLDYSRGAGEWVPNENGGRENLGALSFLRKMSEIVYGEYPDVQTIAEESTAWGGVSRPTFVGGLGFGMKWDMGWMHDTLEYLQRDPIHRSFHHSKLTFRMIYAFTENFVLSLSHDECVHGKGSLLDKMPGDAWQRFANLRLLYGYQFASPGKKLQFMGGEFGQWREWRHDESLDWHLLEEDAHRGVSELVKALNRLYREEPALHELDFVVEGFEWVEADDSAGSVVAFLRRARDRSPILVLMNCTPVVRLRYRVGVDRQGRWHELLNTDASRFGGSGVENPGPIESRLEPAHGRPYSIEVNLPPLAAVFLKPVLR